MRYQTEIFVPQDRYVCLQLPDYLPEGRALVTVTITIEEGGPEAEDRFQEPDGDRHDIEWWDEFDDEEIGRRP